MDSHRHELKNQNFSLPKNQINVIGASQKVRRKILSVKEEHFTFWISEFCQREPEISFFQKKDDCFDNMQIYPADYRQRYVNVNEGCYVYLWSRLFSAVSTGGVNEWAKSYFLTEYVSEKENLIDWLSNHRL